MVYDLISVIILLFLGGTPERRNLLVYDFMSSKMHLLTSYLRRYMYLRIHTHTTYCALSLLCRACNGLIASDVLPPANIHLLAIHTALTTTVSDVQTGKLPE